MHSQQKVQRVYSKDERRSLPSRAKSICGPRLQKKIPSFEVGQFGQHRFFGHREEERGASSTKTLNIGGGGGGVFNVLPSSALGGGSASNRTASSSEALRHT